MPYNYTIFLEVTSQYSDSSIVRKPNIPTLEHPLFRHPKIPTNDTCMYIYACINSLTSEMTNANPNTNPNHKPILNLSLIPNPNANHRL